MFFFMCVCVLDTEIYILFDNVCLKFHFGALEHLATFVLFFVAFCLYYSIIIKDGWMWW